MTPTDTNLDLDDPAPDATRDLDATVAYHSLTNLARTTPGLALGTASHLDDSARVDLEIKTDAGRRILLGFVDHIDADVTRDYTQQTTGKDIVTVEYTERDA